MAPVDVEQLRRPHRTVRRDQLLPGGLRRHDQPRLPAGHRQRHSPHCPVAVNPYGPVRFGGEPHARGRELERRVGRQQLPSGAQGPRRRRLRRRRHGGDHDQLRRHQRHRRQHLRVPRPRRNGTGPSGFSDPASATTPVARRFPPLPANLTATAVSSAGGSTSPGRPRPGRSPTGSSARGPTSPPSPSSPAAWPARASRTTASRRTRPTRIACRR